jgi:hypothetical protein
MSNTPNYPKNDDLDIQMKDLMKREMLAKIEERINNGDKEVLSAFKILLEEEDSDRTKF